MTMSCVVEVPFGNVVAVFDFCLRGGFVFSEELVHVALEGGYAEGVIETVVV